MNNAYSVYNIVNADGSALVADYGALVADWTPAGGEPVLWQSAIAGDVPGVSARGGVPIVFPWFNGGYEHGRMTAKTPKHGFARTSLWQRDESAASDRHMRYTLDSDAIAPDELARITSGPDSRFHAAFDVDMGRELTMTLTVTNTGDRPLKYEAALHTYLRVGDVTRIRLAGLRDARYLDATMPGFPERTQQDADVTFDGGTVDRIYYSDARLTLHDDGLHRAIVIGKTGSSQTVVWNPGETGSATISNLGDDEWRGFVCVEAAANRELAVTVPAGRSHALSQTLRVEQA